MSRPYDASPRFGAFTLRTECPRCGAHLPANGPAPRVACAACDAEVEVPAPLLGGMLERFERAWPKADGSGAETIGDLTWRWTSEMVDGPVCAACRGVLSGEPELARCACGAVERSTPLPDALRGLVESKVRIFGADPDVLPEPVAAPVAMTCPQCGAGLTFTSSHQRLTPCAHCGVTIHIPDAVWRALHPPRTVRPWVARFDGESRPGRAARIAREREERARERALEEAERRKEQAAARERKEEEARLRREAAALELQAERARKAAAERRRNLMLTPLLGLSWVAGFGGAAALAGTSAWYTFGPLNLLRPLMPEVFWATAPRPAVLLGFVTAVVGWGVVNASIAVRTRQKLREIMTFSTVYLVLAHVPMLAFVAGPGLALAYINGAEPSGAQHKDRIPSAWRPPGAVLLLTFAVCWVPLMAAVFGLPVLGPRGFWSRFLG
jgi:uncharacterized protein (DUF983 family)